MKRLLFTIYLISFLFLWNATAQVCKADFNFNTNNLTVSFSDTSYSNTGPYTSSWNFGNGVTSTNQSPTYTYNSAGIYNVCLTISDSICSDSICYQVVVSTSNNCQANFYYQVTALTVQFYDSSFVSNVSNYSWQFGDGNFSTQTNPTNNYGSAGNYVVGLSIYDSLTNCFSQKLDTIAVLAPHSCVAGFNYSVSSDTVRFTNIASNFLNVLYDFGDGATSFSNDPIHIYNQPGIYIINQTVTDSTINCSDSFTDTVTILTQQSCSAGFIKSIQFNAVSIYNIASNYSTILYDFGDGTTSNQTDPMHVYAQPGQFVICQTVTNSNCTSIFCDTVNIQLPCKAGFSLNINQNVVYFLNQAQNFTSILYDFGDGSSSNSLNPTHIYQSNGTYIVSQSISNDNGCSNVFYDTIFIRVTPPCGANFTSNTTNDTTYFNSNSNSYNRLNFDFGDGTSSTLPNPFHQYTNSGNYRVSLKVYNDTTSCIDSISKVITVSISTSCYANFSLALDTNNSKKLYLINNSSSDPSHSYFWNFGDGATSNLKNPTHHYSNNQAYNICITVTDSLQNCISNFCDSVGLDSNGQILKSRGFNLTVIDGSAIGIKEIPFLDGIKIYPNPTSSILKIEVPNFSSQLNYNLYSIRGTLLKSSYLTASNSEIDLAGIIKGLYLLKIDNKNKVIVRKIVKQ